MGPVEIDRPSTWMKFRPSLCEGCFAGCCTLPVEVTEIDLLRLELISEDEALGSLKKVAKRLEKEGIAHSFRVKTKYFILTQRQNGDCRFLDEKRRCSVYDKRPQVCRRFPDIGPRPGFCPCQPQASNANDWEKRR